MLIDLLLQFPQLIGWALFVTIIINILKTFDIVKDGTATKWSAGLNLIGLVGFLSIGLFAPDLDILMIDNSIKQIAELLIVLLGYATTLISSKVIHSGLRTLDVPVFGASHSKGV